MVFISYCYHESFIMKVIGVNCFETQCKVVYGTATWLCAYVITM